MTVRTLLRYLIGNRQAILDLASSRWSLLVGALFVLSAGFAREYDGSDLRREPWHLALPFGASLVSSLALFCLAWCGQFRKEPRPVFVSAYLSFLGLFWMTAPLAWFYAVPYEHFLSAVDAVRANLWTLGLVSVWRVALMSRVLVVLLNYRPWAAVSVVLLFGDTVALFLLQFVPIPLIDLMGGLHLTDSDRLLQEVTIGVLFAGGCSFVLWLFLAALAFAESRLRWEIPAPVGAPSFRPSVPLLGLALVSLAIWAMVLPFTQPEQQLRFRVEKLFQTCRVRDAVAEMSAHQLSEFPPHWNPPPRVYFSQGQHTQVILDVCNEFAAQPTAKWVSDCYLRKLRLVLSSPWVSEPTLHEAAKALRALPESEAVLAELEQAGYPHHAALIRTCMREPPNKP